MTTFMTIRHKGSLCINKQHRSGVKTQTKTRIQASIFGVNSVFHDAALHRSLNIDINKGFDKIFFFMSLVYDVILH